MIASPHPIHVSPIDQLIDALVILYSKQDEVEGLRRLQALDTKALDLVGRLVIHRSICEACWQTDNPTTDICHEDFRLTILECAVCYVKHGPDGELRERLSEWHRAGLHPEGHRYYFLLEIGGELKGGFDASASETVSEWESFELTLPPSQRIDVRAEVSSLQMRACR